MRCATTIIIHVAHWNCTSIRFSLLPKRTILSSPEETIELFSSPFLSSIFYPHFNLTLSFYNMYIYIYTYTLLAMKGAARTENGAFSLFTSSRFYYSRSVAIFRPCYSKSCAELKGSSRSSYAVVGPCFFVLEIIHLPFPSPLKLVQRHPVCPLSLLVAVCIKLRCATHLSLSLSRVKRLEVNQV